MRSACFVGKMGMLLVAAAPLVILGVAPGHAVGQEKAAAPADKAAGLLQTLDEEYNRQLLQLDQRRLAQLGRLAETLKPADASAIYERLFRLAVAGDLFRDAEAAAVNVIKQGTPSPTTHALAHLVNIIAEADRGAFDESLKSLRQAVSNAAQEKAATEARANLAPDEIIGILEAYYQRLVEANQFPIAHEAFQLALEQSYRPAVKDFLASRLKRIDLIGKAAPAIEGTDLDGKAFDLSSLKGKVVLVVFWASWCLPNAAQVTWLEQAQDAYHNRGLEVVGINLDLQQDGAQKLENALPNIRRFLLDYNVPWPTLVSGAGKHDYAAAYGISDIPANVLIGRDGKVVQIDLSRRNLEPVITKILAP